MIRFQKLVGWGRSLRWVDVPAEQAGGLVAKWTPLGVRVYQRIPAPPGRWGYTLRWLPSGVRAILPQGTEPWDLF